MVTMKVSCLKLGKIWFHRLMRINVILWYWWKWK